MSLGVRKKIKKTRRKSNAKKISRRSLIKSVRELKKSLSVYKRKYWINASISVFVLVIGSFILFPSLYGLAAPTHDTYTLTTQADFDAGTFVETISENSSGGEIRLAGGSGPDGTLYLRDITISSTNTNVLTEYQILIDGFDSATLVSAGKMQNDCDDLRFTNSGGTSIPYSIVGATCNTTDTEIWVQVDSIAASGNTIIRMFYGAPSAIQGSSEADTFSYTTEKTVGYVLNTYLTSMQVMTLEADNSVTHNGVTRTLTSEMDTSSFSSIAGYGSVSAKKLFEMKNTTASDLIVPVSWAGTEFILSNRNSAYDMNLTMVSPWGTATVDVYVDGSSCGSTRNITNVGYRETACGNSGFDVVRVVSTNGIPILVNKTDFGGNDPMPIHPVSLGPWYGFESTQLMVKAGPSGADYRWIDSGAGAETNPGNLGANAYVDVSTGGGSWYSGDTVRVRSVDNPIGVQSFADADGGDSTTFMLRRDFGTKFGSPFSTDFIAITTDQATTCRTYNSSGSLYQTVSLSSANTEIFELGGSNFGIGNSSTYLSGKWRVECDDPVMVVTQYTDDEQNMFSYPMMRQFTYPTPTVGSVGSEGTALAVSGTWESNDAASAIDIVWNGGWDNNANGNAFEATVSGEVNTDIDFEIRLSTDKSTWTNWYNMPDLDADAGRFGVPATTLESQFPQATYFAHRYIQVKAILTQSDSVTNPTLSDISISYLKDVDAPSSNPTTMQCWNDSGKTTEYISGNWYNDPEIYCEWSGASDPYSGVAGYYLHTDVNSGADPETEGTSQSATSATLNIFTTNDSNFLLLKTYDLVGNVTSSTFNGFEYKYDATNPQNPAGITPNPAGFTNVNDFSFSWQAGSDTNGSGVQEYCYKTDEAGFTEVCTTSTNVSGITAYQEGSNLFYVRTKDNVGNLPTFYTQVSYYFSQNSPTPPQGLGVTPSVNSINSFTFNWFEPASFSNPIAKYHYSINALPGPGNTTETTSAETTALSVGPGPYATQQGSNLFYLVAEDTAGNIEWTSYASVEFTANTTAPGIPTDVTLTDSSIRAQSKYSLTLTWNEPVDVGSGIDHYIIDRSTDVNCDTDPLAVFAQRATATGTGYLDTELSNTVTYCYRVKSADNAGAESIASSIVSMLPEGRFTEPPSLIGNPSVEPRIQSADVEWLTDREGSSFAEFGTTPAYGQVQGVDNFVSAHQITLLNLAPNTLYYYRVRFTDQDSNTGYSSQSTFTTADAPSKPTNLSVTPTTNTINSFAFSWDEPIDEGIDIQGYLYSINEVPTNTNTSFISSKSLLSASYATRQGVNVFYVVAIDTSNNVNYNNYASVNFSAATPAPPIPTGVIITDASNRETEDYSIALKWKKNDVQASSESDATIQYVIYQSIDNTTFSSIANVQTTGYLDVDLDNSIEYFYYVVAQDSAGSTSAPSTVVSEIPEGRFTSPPEITQSPSVSAGSFSATITWKTNRDADSHIEYGKTNDLEEEQGTIEEASDHLVKLEGLDPKTNYYYRIRSRDSDGNIALSTIATFTTLDAPTISNVEISDIRLYDALVSWKTNLPLTTVLEYGETTEYGFTFADTTGSLSTDHLVKMQNLSDGTLFHIRLRGTDEDGNTILSDDYTFNTLTFPEVLETSFENKSEGQTEIRWKTNVPTTSIVEYYAENISPKTQGTQTYSTDHAILLFGLEDATRYSFVVRGQDRFSYNSVSEEQEFVTLEDTTPPEIFGVNSESNTIGSGEASKVQIVVSWKTDEATTSQVEYGAGISASDFTSQTDENAELVQDHLVVISELAAAKTYKFRVVSRDKAGNETKSSSYTVLTSRTRESFLQLLIGNLEETFSWVGNLGNLL